MQAQTLNCPMCGAAAATESTRCEHCGARLATVACPSCFGLMFLGSKYCSHCGTKADHKKEGPGSVGRCPRCSREHLSAVTIGSIEAQECPRCAGIWVDRQMIEKVILDREQQASVLGAATVSSQGTTAFEQNIRYVPCPICHQLMNRVNFARCSAIVVDVCRGHGTWFDRDELRRAVEFIRSGGLAKARAKELAELKEQEQRLRQLQASRGQQPDIQYSAHTIDLADGISAVADVLWALFDSSN